MNKTNINLLKERVTFLKRTLIQTEEGEFHENWQDCGKAWAMIKPLPLVNQRITDTWHVLEGKKILGMYKVAMRKNINRNALHADFKALLWKYKILEILFPFQENPLTYFLEGVVIDCGKERENG